MVSKKIRAVFFPYLAIALITATVTTTLRWLLTIGSDVVERTERFWEMYIPIVIAAPLLLFWLRPRLSRLSDIVEGKPKDRNSQLLIAGLTIIISNILLQAYVSTNTGKLTQCDVADIDKYKLTKFTNWKDMIVIKTIIVFIQVNTKRIGARI